jgi:phage shock protein PspC (stress-responsive transcriptional regulator)
MPRHGLRRCPHNRLVAGVAAGVADYLEVDRSAVRVALVLLTLVAGVGIPAYLAAWLLIPEEGADDSLADALTERWAQR